MKIGKNFFQIFIFLTFLIAPWPLIGETVEVFNWEKYKVDVSSLSKEQIAIIEETIIYLRSINPEKIKINKNVYQRLSRFEEVFSFPFEGEKLTRWLLKRIRKIRKQNTWTTAVNRNKGEFILGDRFFTDLNMLERIYLLIHEARHSDDRGHKHVKCPKGFKIISAGQPEMDLEREKTCDNENKGAYSYQAAFLFELYSYGIFDQREVGLLYNSSILRVIQ